MAKRRKRGRPATGHDPMVGVRLPAAVVRQVDKMAAEIGADRSMIIRLMVEYVLEHGSLPVRTTRSLLVGGLRGWKGRGRASDMIASAAIANIKAHAAAYLAARKGSKTSARHADVIKEAPTHRRLPKN
jgi:hypothetical protein